MGGDNAVSFELSKAEAILLSRSRRHWKGRAMSGVRVHDRVIPYNRRATRWLGIWIDSRLSFKDNVIASETRARKAERRLSAFVRRNGVPPLCARHLQEAIIGSTLMRGTEVTWRGQSFMRDGVKRAINRMSRASLEVFGSTPVGFLEAVGGSMPAVPRMRMRQAAYAGRVSSASQPSTRQITMGRNPLAVRLREAIGTNTGDTDGPDIERVGPSRGLRFPGNIILPEMATGEKERARHREKAIEVARSFETDTKTVWTDGSALPGGTCAAAVVRFVEGEGVSRRQENRVVVERKGILRRGERRARNLVTCGSRLRSFRRFDSERGFRAEPRSPEGGAVALDAKVAASVRGTEVCAMSAGPGDSFNISTDPQAVMTRLMSDQAGPRQENAV